MIMATGLAVDYSVYFTQKFMATSGATRTERVQKAMSHTGYAVFLGGFTALVGTIPLAFASSKVCDLSSQPARCFWSAAFI